MYKFSRRQLAASATAGLLLAPFYSLLNPSPVIAASGKKAKRLLLFCTMGTKPDLWTPTKLSGESIGTFSASTAPLNDAAVRDKLVLIEGMPTENPANNHGAPDGITGMGNGYYAVNNVQQLIQSVDQFVADGLVKSGINRPIASLILGSETAGSNSLFFRAGKNLPPIASPVSAYNTVFSAVPSGGGGGGNNTQPDKLLARRRSILDTITAEANALRDRVGAADKTKLDSHLESIRALENKLSQSSGSGGGGNNNPPVMCTPPAKPTDSSSKYPAIANDLLHLDIIVNAFACDITRVASIQWGTDQALQVDLPGLQGDQHNGFIHSGAPDFKNLIAFEAYLCTTFVNLLKSLQSKPEPTDPSTTLFDNTLVVWCRDMGDAVDHNMKSMRFVLSGGAGGYLKYAPGGRYLNDTGRHERVLLNICEAMGITTYTGFGDPKLTTKTPLPSLAA